jgi:hypothetical protein
MRRRLVAKKLGASYRQSDYSGIPDVPNGRGDLLIAAAKRAAVSGAIDAEYEALPEAVRNEFGLLAFKRQVAKWYRKSSEYTQDVAALKVKS